jgi:hypothetical protein
VLQTEIVEQEALIVSLQAAIALANQNIIALDDSLSAQIDNNAAKIAYIESELAQINADLALKQNIINGYCLNGEAIKQILPDGSVVCGQAGMTGQLETVYTFVQVFANPSQFVQGVAMCPPGYNITGSGYASAQNWRVQDINPEVDGALNYTVIRATNLSSTRDDIVPVATCSRIAP